MEKLILKLKKNNIRIKIVDGKLNLIVPDCVNSLGFLEEVKRQEGAIIDFFQKELSKIPVLLPDNDQVVDFDVSPMLKAALLSYIHAKVPGSFNMNQYSHFKYLDVEALRKSIVRIVERHESLRVRIVMLDGKIRMKYRSVDPDNIVVDCIDARGAVDHEEEIRRVFHEIDNDHVPIRPGVDPYIDLMIKTKVIRVGDDDYFFLFSVPHIICDAWSMAFLQLEFLELYNGYLFNKSVVLSPPSMQLTEYISWVNTFLASNAGEDLKKYWYRALENLGHDYLLEDYVVKKGYVSRSHKEQITTEIREVFKPMVVAEEQAFFDVVLAVKYEKGKKYRYIICKEEMDKLSQLAIRWKLNFHVLVMATFILLLYRLTHKNDLILGLVLALRGGSGVASLVNNLTNVVILRTEMEANQSLESYVHALSQKFSEVYAHKLYPFERLLNELDVSVKSIGTIFLNILSEEVGQSVSQFSQGDQEQDSYSTFDLYCAVQRFLDGLVITCDYQCRVFRPETIHYFFCEYGKLLGALLRCPQASVQEVTHF